MLCRLTGFFWFFCSHKVVSYTLCANLFLYSAESILLLVHCRVVVHTLFISLIVQRQLDSFVLFICYCIHFRVCVQERGTLLCRPCNVSR